MARHLATGPASGAGWQAWLWVLTGNVSSPISLAAPTGWPPTNLEVAAEIAADPQTSGNSSEEIALARQILEWITGQCDDPPDVD